MTTPLRLGIIGTGFIADVIAHALRGTTEVTLNAVASRRVETASAFALRHGSVAVFESWESLLESGTVDAVYVATNGPRFETPAEIRMYDRLGGDVVGMTGVPEIVLAREAGMHFAAVAYSVNWCSGIMDVLELHEEDMVETRQNLARLLVDALCEMAEPDCRCADAVMVMHPAKD